MKKMVLLLLLLTCTAWAAVDPQADAAQRAFLKLVDAAQYGKAYGTCAETLKTSATGAQFATAIRSLRDKLGPLVKRRLEKAAPSKSLPGAPPGNYVVFVYKTDFAKHKGVTELVVTSEVKGSWKVAGYSFH